LSDGAAGSASKIELMARRPAEIILSAEERRELERRAACYTLPHTVVQRAKLVLYAAEGQSNVEIAGRLDANPDVIGRWLLGDDDPRVPQCAKWSSFAARPLDEAKVCALYNAVCGSLFAY
jgi:hypothetical protein